MGVKPPTSFFIVTLTNKNNLKFQWENFTVSQIRVRLVHTLYYSF